MPSAVKKNEEQEEEKDDDDDDDVDIDFTCAIFRKNRSNPVVPSNST